MNILKSKTLATITLRVRNLVTSVFCSLLKFNQVHKLLLFSACLPHFHRHPAYIIRRCTQNKDIAFRCLTLWLVCVHLSMPPVQMPWGLLMETPRWQ